MNVKHKMKTLLTIMATTTLSFFAPIGITIVILLGFILLDTIVKIASLYAISKREQIRFMDIFLSKTLRVKFVLKSLGYLVLIIPITIMDILVLTPALTIVLEAFFSHIYIPTDALFANILVVIFCGMELYSVNENWDVISNVNLFKRVSEFALKIRRKINTVVEFIQELKRVKE